MSRFQHIFFDMDNTITRSRGTIESAMAKALDTLANNRNVVIVSGAVHDQIRTQVGSDLHNRLYILAQNGNAAHAPGGVSLWHRTLSDDVKRDITAHIEQLKSSEHLNKLEIDHNDTVEDRGAQISYSLIGHNAKRDTKEAFDPRGERRRALLDQFPFTSDRGEVVIGGTTCLDYIERGKTKGANVNALIRQNDWQSKECLYIGDALFAGGNDETVIGICPTRTTAHPEETLEIIQSILENRAITL